MSSAEACRKTQKPNIKAHNDDLYTSNIHIYIYHIIHDEYFSILHPSRRENTNNTRREYTLGTPYTRLRAHTNTHMHTHDSPRGDPSETDCCVTAEGLDKAPRGDSSDKDCHMLQPIPTQSLWSIKMAREFLYVPNDVPVRPVKGAMPHSNSLRSFGQLQQQKIVPRSPAPSFER